KLIGLYATAGHVKAGRTIGALCEPSSSDRGLAASSGGPGTASPRRAAAASILRSCRFVTPGTHEHLTAITSPIRSRVRDRSILHGGSISPAMSIWHGNGQ